MSVPDQNDDIILIPGDGGARCPGNGAQGMEPQCDECDYLICCTNFSGLCDQCFRAHGGCPLRL